MNNGGCLRLGLAALSLVVTLPLTTIQTIVRRWRRGSDCLVTVKRRLDRENDTLRFELDIDVPLDQELVARREIVDCLVRLAESLSAGDEHYHLAFREAGESEPHLIPLGPLIQTFGERLIHTLGRASLERRTCLWLCADRRRAIVDLIDPINFDPESSEADEAVMVDPAVNWLVLTSFARRSVNILQRTVVVLPAPADATMTALITRIKNRLAAPR